MLTKGVKKPPLVEVFLFLGDGFYEGFKSKELDGLGIPLLFHNE